MKKDYYVRRDLVNEQINHEENIYHDYPKSKSEIILDSSFISDDLPIPRSTNSNEPGESHIPEIYWG